MELIKEEFTMPYFVYHPVNNLAKKLIEANDGKDSFSYRSRPEMEMIIGQHLQLAKIDIDPRMHMIIGSLAGTVLHQMNLDQENELHRQIIKYCDKNKSSWSFVKLNNGPSLKCVIGYCNSDPSTPFLLSSAQLAQKGIINSSFIPT